MKQSTYPWLPESRWHSGVRPHSIEPEDACPRCTVRSANCDDGAGRVVELGPAGNYRTHEHAKHQFSWSSRDDPTDLGAGKPLAHQVSAERLLGSGTCSLLEVLLKHPICRGTGVPRKNREMAGAKLVAA